MITDFQKAKRSLFDKLYRSLNARQREAVFSVNGPLLILAGAGSGKTTVLVKRIAFIIKYGNAYFEDTPIFGEGDAERLNAAASLSDEEIETVLSEYKNAPCPPWAILTFTFTNKAANEMKERLEREIGDAASEIWAGTFHSICMRILRRNAASAGYDSNFTI